MDIQEKLKISRVKHLLKIHHKIKLQLDKVCQEASGGDLNLEEFMVVYNNLKDEEKTLLYRHSMLNSMKHD